MQVSVTVSGEGLVVPTSETLKQEFFLKLAIRHEFLVSMITMPVIIIIIDIIINIIIIVIIIMKLAIRHEFPLSMIGPSGTGKTFLTCGLIASLSTEKFINNIVNFSARTNVNYTQVILPYYL